MAENNRRALPKSFPTTVNTFVKMFLGKNPTDLTISDEQLGQLVLQHVKDNPETARLFNIVSYTFSPEVQAKLNFYDKQIKDIESRQKDREAKHKEWYDKKYFDKDGNPKVVSEKTKKEEEKWGEKLKRGADADRRAIQSLEATRHTAERDEKDKVNSAASENEKLEREREKLIGNIAIAEQKKTDEEEKRKRAKAKLVGGQIADAIEGVAGGFNLGRRIRGY